LLVVVPIGFAWLFVRSPGLSLSARVGYVRAAAASVAPSFFASSILIAAMLPFLLPGAIWLAVRTNSVLTLVCAVWAFSIVVCVAGLCVLAVVHGVSSIAQRAINRRRIATKALMISAGLLLLIAGIYLSSQTLVWSKPFIDGAGLLR
jgi:hypothetical protein